MAWAQRCLYRRVLATTIEGGQFVPAEGGFLVASNHASHLDAGLIKMALGGRGPQLRALAAKDYFFAQAWSRWYFENFTNVLAFDRHGGFRTSLKRALGILAEGMPLLIFPEGTRSMSGAMAPFKPAISSMALMGRAAILPIFLEGTATVLPKGRWLFRGRRIKARIGRPLTPAFLEQLTSGLSRHEAYRRATEALELVVHALGRGETLSDEAICERLAARAAGRSREARRPAEPEAKGRSQYLKGLA